MRDGLCYRQEPQKPNPNNSAVFFKKYKKKKNHTAITALPEWEFVSFLEYANSLK